MKEKMMIMLAMKALKYGLSSLQPLMSENGFKKVVDLALNEVESFFEEGSWKDVATELVCTEVRTYLEVEDSNPDN